MTDEPTLRSIFATFHLSEMKLDDKLIDSLLGIKLDEPNLNKLRQTIGDEQFRYEATPYSYIRRFTKTIDPLPHDVVYDLGSGYGRVVLYGALTSGALWKGIEIVPERVAAADKIRDEKGIANAIFFTGHAADFDLSDGTIFFLFNPFSNKTLSEIGEKLQEISMDKRIKIVTWGGTSNEYFAAQKWLMETTPKGPSLTWKMQFFESK